MIRNTLQQLYLKCFKGRYYGRHRADIDTYLKWIPVGSLCFDVGANKGEKSKALLAAGMRVLAFEPQPDCVEFLTRHCEGFSQKLTVRQTAMGDECGSITLYQTEVPGHASVYQEWSDSDQKKEIEVPLSTLDDEIREWGLPYYIKIDVEGHEYHVLKGLSRLVPLISFEYHMNPQGLQKTQDCINRLSELGAVELNLVSAASNEFYLGEWLAPDAFFQLFPEQFKGNRDFRYGDIFVRTKSLSSR